MNNLPNEGSQVLAKMSDGNYRVLETYLDTPTFEDTYTAFLYWDDPNNDGADISIDDVVYWSFISNLNLRNI